jgi:hypothetical protein
MSKNLHSLPIQHPHGGDLREDGDLSDMLSELRILLPGAQMLTAFLIILPFSGGARQIILAERVMFLATFFFALSSLVLMTAPAIQHRLMRPLNSRGRFKRVATRLIVAGSGSLAVAFTLGTNLVISSVFGKLPGNLASVAMAAMIASLWYALPWYLKRCHGF